MIISKRFKPSFRFIEMQSRFRLWADIPRGIQKPYSFYVLLIWWEQYVQLWLDL